MRLPNFASLTLSTRAPYRHQNEARPRAPWMSMYRVVSRGDGGPLPESTLPLDEPSDDELAREWVEQHSGPARLPAPAPAPAEEEGELADVPGGRGRFGEALPASPASSKDEEVLEEGQLRPPPGPTTPPGRRPASARAAQALREMSRKDRLAAGTTPRGILQPWQGPWLMEGFTSTRPRLYVAQTQLRGGKQGQRLPQYGVYCHTTIEPGEFICAFSGNFMRKGKFDRQANVKREMRRHAVQLDFHAIGGEAEESQMLYVLTDEGPGFAYRYVAQCLNEPARGDAANATFFQHQYAKDVRKNEYYSAVLVYAAYRILAHQEIYLYYGEGYEDERKRNNYEAGEPAEWDEALVRRPSMDAVVQAILANGERADEILFREGQGEEEEVVPSRGSKRRGSMLPDRLTF